nr:MAG TPA: Multidrug efflux pump subunit AcrB transporter, Multidrug efflux pump [Bacteriophage sp.]
MLYLLTKLKMRNLLHSLALLIVALALALVLLPLGLLWTLGEI